MIWTLLLCHFIADYPLQTDAMVNAKKRVIGLTAHVMIHFVTMMVVMTGILQIDLLLVLPAIVSLTGFHFIIDTWKNILSNIKPDWVIFAYIQDQVLHIASILLIVTWMESNINMLDSLAQSSWTIPALSMLLVTHVYFITEKVVVYKYVDYQLWINVQSWSRMISRGLMLSASFLGWNIWAILIVAIGLVYHWQDISGPFHMRALLIDVSVVLVVIVGLNGF